MVAYLHSVIPGCLLPLVSFLLNGLVGQLEKMMHYHSWEDNSSLEQALCLMRVCQKRLSESFCTVSLNEQLLFVRKFRILNKSLAEGKLSLEGLQSSREVAELVTLLMQLPGSPQREGSGQHVSQEGSGPQGSQEVSGPQGSQEVSSFVVSAFSSMVHERRAVLVQQLNEALESVVCLSQLSHSLANDMTIPEEENEDYSGSPLALDTEGNDKGKHQFAISYNVLKNIVGSKQTTSAAGEDTAEVPEPNAPPSIPEPPIPKKRKECSRTIKTMKQDFHKKLSGKKSVPVACECDVKSGDLDEMELQMVQNESELSSCVCQYELQGVPCACDSQPCQPPPNPFTSWCWRKLLLEFQSVEDVHDYIETVNLNILRKLDTECHETICHAIVSVFEGDSAVCLVRALNQRSVDQFDVRDKNGDTPLHKAVVSGDLIVVKELIGLYAAAVRVQNSNHFTPLDIAKQGNCLEIIDCLLKGFAYEPHNDSTTGSHLGIDHIPSNSRMESSPISISTSSTEESIKKSCSVHKKCSKSQRRSQQRARAQRRINEYRMSTSDSDTNVESKRQHNKTKRKYTKRKIYTDELSHSGMESCTQCVSHSGMEPCDIKSQLVTNANWQNSCKNNGELVVGTSLALATAVSSLVVGQSLIHQTESTVWGSNEAMEIPLTTEATSIQQCTRKTLSTQSEPGDHKDRLRSAAELLHAQDYPRIVIICYGGEPPAHLPSHLKIPYVFITGLAYYKMSNHKKSVQYFGKCLGLAEECDRDGDVTICNIYLGDIDFAKRKYTEAAGRYQNALYQYSRDSVAKDFRMILPTKSAVWLKCGSAFKNTSRVGDAVHAYEKAVELAASKKDQLSARTSLGNLFQGIGENERAKIQYEEAIKLATELEDHISLGWNHGNLGNALLGLHQRDKALHHLFKALDMAVDHEMTPQAIGRAYNNLGTAFQSLNELSKAEEHYDLALAQAIYGNDIPGQARVYGNIGNLQMLNKQYDRAVSHILKCNPILHEQATKEAMMMRLMNAKVIHLATHGSAAAGFLAFAGMNSSTNEAVDSRKVLIYPHEVESLNISPALVVLSSCDSGRGVFKADGIQGMARAFILAGAQAVLTALWRVPDESACIFMHTSVLQELHRYISCEVSPHKDETLQLPPSPELKQLLHPQASPPACCNTSKESSSSLHVTIKNTHCPAYTLQDTLESSDTHSTQQFDFSSVPSEVQVESKLQLMNSLHTEEQFGNSKVPELSMKMGTTDGTPCTLNLESSRDGPQCTSSPLHEFNTMEELYTTVDADSLMSHNDYSENHLHSESSQPTSLTSEASSLDLFPPAPHPSVVEALKSKCILEYSSTEESDAKREPFMFKQQYTDSMASSASCSTPRKRSVSMKRLKQRARARRRLTKYRLSTSGSDTNDDSKYLLKAKKHYPPFMKWTPQHSERFMEDSSTDNEETKSSCTVKECVAPQPPSNNFTFHTVVHALDEDKRLSGVQEPSPNEETAGETSSFHSDGNNNAINHAECVSHTNTSLVVTSDPILPEPTKHLLGYFQCLTTSPKYIVICLFLKGTLHAIKVFSPQNNACNDLKAANNSELHEILNQTLSNLQTETLQKVLIIIDHQTDLLAYALTSNLQAEWINDFYFQVILYPPGVTDPGNSAVCHLCPSNKNCVVGNPTVDDLPSLLYATTEAHYVAHALNCVPILHEDATKGLVFKRMENATTIHLATHASGDGIHFAFTCDGVSTVLTPHDIKSLNGKPVLVVLSSCNSAIMNHGADEIKGIAMAFIQAGAQAVVATSSTVQDRSSLMFMQFFYQYLIIDGIEGAKAMHKAMQCIRCFPEFSDPFYWSCYRYYGKAIQFFTCKSPHISSNIGASSVFPRLEILNELKNALINNPRPPSDVQVCSVSSSLHYYFNLSLLYNSLS